MDFRFNTEQYYTLIPEMQAGKGYADLVYIPLPKYPDKPAILVELISLSFRI